MTMGRKGLARANSSRCQLSTAHKRPFFFSGCVSLSFSLCVCLLGRDRDGNQMFGMRNMKILHMIVNDQFAVIIFTTETEMPKSDVNLTYWRVNDRAKLLHVSLLK